LNPYVYVENGPTGNTDPTGRFLIEALIGAAVGAGVGYFGCAIFTGGWTSSACGEAAAIGAGIGALAGLTDGLSLLGGPGVCEEDPEACTAPPEPTTDPTTTCLCPEPPTTPTTITTDTAPVKASISNVERGNLGVDASVNDLGENYVGREVPVSSETYGNGRIDIFSTGPKSYIESKNVQNLYLTKENELQLAKYVDAVGGEDLQYDLHVNYVHPMFLEALDAAGVVYRILPYIPSP
jgi:hypothetical protein